MNELYELALKSWRDLNENVNKLDEEDTRFCLIHEATTRKRNDIIKRLHQRYSSLRNKRERFELSVGITKSLEKGNINEG